MHYKEINHKNNILHIGKYFYSFKGGIEKAIKITINSNYLKNYNQSLISFSEKNETYKKNNIIFFNYKILFTLFSQPFSFSYCFKALTEIKKNNIIFFHFPNLLVLIFSLFIKNNKKLFIYWHADIINYHKLNFLISWLEKLMLKKAYKIIVATKSYANSSKTLQLFKDKIEIIPYGIDSSHLTSNYKDSFFYKNELAKLKDKKILLSVGRLVNYKRFDMLIKLMNFLDENYYLFIVGSGQELNNLVRLIKENKKNNIKILRNLSDYNLEVLYKSSFLYVSCSQGRQESFGISLIEAQKFSLPIITTNTDKTGMLDINIDSKTGLNLKSKNLQNISNKIRYLNNNKSLIKQFKKEAKINFNLFYRSQRMQKRISRLISIN